MKNKIIPLVLASSLCVSLLAGCQSSELRSYKADQSTQASTSAAELDYTPCYETYDADKVMLTVDGTDITWGELFYWYVYGVTNLEQYYGTITDWKAKCAADETKTNEEYVKETALENIKQYCAVENKAKEKNVALTDEDKASIESTWKQNVQNYGGGDEAAFETQLKKAYLTKDLYNHFNELNMIYSHLVENLYGADGEKLTQDQILTEAAKLGYVRAKNLMISTQDDSGNTLTGDALTAKKTLADKLETELKGITDQTALEKRFDELVAQYGGDTGTQYYPDGYTFIPGKGTMDTNFESAVSSTQEHQVSAVVETSYGYHIVLRLPLSTDAAVEIASDNSVKKLGYYVAQQLFTDDATGWAKAAKVEYSSAYKRMKLAKVFSKAKAVSSASPSPTASAQTSAAAASGSPTPAAEASVSPAA